MTRKPTCAAIATALALALPLLAAARPAAADVTITQWNFENQGITGAPPYNNSPTASTGTGTATVLGMTNNYPTPNPSVAGADILADTGSSDPNSQQAWRIRGVGLSASAAANGWYSGAPQYTQGAEFDVSTAGFSGIKVSFDWQPTTRGVEDVELQYNMNVNNASGWVNAQLFANTVSGGIWNNGNAVNLATITAVANDANFGIRIVSAYDPTAGTYLDTTGTALNNSSGNIRFDNVTITGVAVAVPEPSAAALAAIFLGLAGVSTWYRRARRVSSAS